MKFYVEKVLSSQEWDKKLVFLKGHPLQSALWGDARRYCDGIHDDRWCIRQNNQIIALIRVEHRGLGPFKKFVAWAPQGPIVTPGFNWSDISQFVLNKLIISKHSLLVISPWEKTVESESLVSRQTIWVDLAIGKQKLWINLDKQWRYGVRRAQNMGVVVEISKEKSRVDAFFKLCQQLSDHKKFKLNGSSALLYFLLNQNDPSESGVEAKLFLAILNHEIAAGAFILRVGKTIHYMWGGVDRKYSKERVGEFIQWQVIDWACSEGYERYDLEGINGIKNPGVAAFKRKMGGEIITLPSKTTWPINWQGRIAAAFIRD